MTRRDHTGAAILATIAVAAFSLWTAGVAQAGCGGVETAKPRKNVNPDGRPPLAIGDSTMLLALPPLAHAGFRVDARGCRMMEEGLEVIRAAKHHDHLPHLVVIALGADASISAHQVEKAFHILGPKRVLGLVTPVELGGWSGHDAAVVRHEIKRHPARGVLLDWVDYSSGHGEWFQPDGLHLTFPGADAFAALLSKSLRYAKAGHRPGRSPGHGGLAQHPVAVDRVLGTLGLAGVFEILAESLR